MVDRNYITTGALLGGDWQERERERWTGSYKGSFGVLCSLQISEQPAISTGHIAHQSINSSVKLKAGKLLGERLKKSIDGSGIDRPFWAAFDKAIVDAHPDDPVNIFLKKLRS